MLPLTTITIGLLMGKLGLATNEYLVVVDNYVDVAYVSSGELI
jgi:hypothetical protein